MSFRTSLESLIRRDLTASLRERAADLRTSVTALRHSTAPSPAPGSEKAKAAWRAACHEHSARTAALGDCPDLMRSKHEVWSTKGLVRAMETGEISVAEYARLHPLASARELRFAEIAHELNIGSLFALAYAEEYPVTLPSTPSLEQDAASALASEDPAGDALLLQLGRQFDAAQAREMAAIKASSDAEERDPSGVAPPDFEAEASKAGDMAAAIAAQIAELPASTAAGFKVKVRALAHYQPHAFKRGLEELPDPDQLLSHSLWRDAQGEAVPVDDPAGRDHDERIAAEFDAALMSGSLSPILPSPAAHDALTPDRAWAVAQASAVDLSALPVVYLHNLFERFAEAADQWLSLAHQPWADDVADSEFRRPNAAGRIIDREQDRAGEIRSRIAEEIRGRTPSSVNEHDWRLETLIRYEIMCEGSLRNAPELRAEIAKAWGA